MENSQKLHAIKLSWIFTENTIYGWEIQSHGRFDWNWRQISVRNMWTKCLYTGI